MPLWGPLSAGRPLYRSHSAADAARLPLMLGELRLPTMKRLWADLAEQSNREGWPAERCDGMDAAAVCRGAAKETWDARRTGRKRSRDGGAVAGGRASP